MENSKLKKYGEDYGVDVTELDKYLYSIGFSSLVGVIKHVESYDKRTKTNPAH